jgi:hypothetical protein
MNNTKKDIINAVLFFAEKYNQKENYEKLISAINTPPEIVKNIIYDMFLNGFNPYFASHTEYEQYRILYDYSKELSTNGYVNFK